MCSSLLFLHESLFSKFSPLCVWKHISVVDYCGITKAAFTSTWMPLGSTCTNPQIDYNWWKKPHTHHSFFFFFPVGCIRLRKSLLGCGASGSSWIKYVNQRWGKTLAMTALREIPIYDVCQPWEGRRILYTAQHINHFFDPTSYRIPRQWLLLVCEPMCVESLWPWGDSPLWRAGKYL